MTTGHCFSMQAICQASAVFNAILILPIPSVWRLKVSLKKWFGIVAVFSTGLLLVRIRVPYFWIIAITWNVWVYHAWVGSLWVLLSIAFLIRLSRGWKIGAGINKWQLLKSFRALTRKKKKPSLALLRVLDGVNLAEWRIIQWLNLCSSKLHTKAVTDWLSGCPKINVLRTTKYCPPKIPPVLPANYRMLLVAIRSSLVSVLPKSTQICE